MRANEIAVEGSRQEALVGQRTTLDVLDQESDLFQSQVDLVQARRDQIVASYRLKAAVGQLTVAGIGLPVQPYNDEAYYDATRNRWIGLGESPDDDASGPRRRCDGRRSAASSSEVSDVTTEPQEQQEPSMEEILSSIRRIIADEEPSDEDGEQDAAGHGRKALDATMPTRPRAMPQDSDDDDVLELTEVVRESGEVVDLEAGGATAVGQAASRRAGSPLRPSLIRADRRAIRHDGGVPGPCHSSPRPAAAARRAIRRQSPIADIRDDEMEQHQTAMQKNGIESLVSDRAAGAATGAFAKLSQAMQRTPPEVAIADEFRPHASSSSSRT